MTTNDVQAITSASAVARVYDTLESAFRMWGDAYLATREDVLAGHTVKEISDAWKAIGNPGIPTSVAMVGSFSAASFLTGTDLYATAWCYAYKGKEVDGELVHDWHGDIEPAHRVIERARKANGMEKVEDVLVTMQSELSDGTDAEKIEDDFSVVLDALLSLKALAVKTPKDDDGEGGEGSEDESGEDESTDESTPDDRAASVIAVLTALIEGGVPASDPMNMEIARLGGLYMKMCAPVKAAKTA